jgi:tRNA U34 5-methylaminomethyl-2-thiouridine-forming methyltransferase MnmC
MRPELELIVTADGSHSLAVPHLDETYHSPGGALTEARHVFVEEGLAFQVGRSDKEKLSVLEVGFGTGLNALLSLQLALDRGIALSYTALEPHPLAEDIYTRLNYCTDPALKDFAARFDQLHCCPWDDPCRLDPLFTLEKRQQRLEDFLSAAVFDVVYFDAFAPNKQPELWERAALEHVVDMMAPQGLLVTYCAQGHFKRNLRALGLEVKRRPGPPGGKFHMVRALKD